MKRFTGITLAVIAVSGGLVLGAGPGQGQGNEGRGKGERGKLRNEFRQEIRAHVQDQRQENQGFRKTLRDMEPAQTVAALKTHREQQYTENKAFMDAEYAKLVEAIKAKLAGKEGGEGKLEEILKKLEARHAEREQKMDARHAEVIAMLNQLSQKADLTWEDVRAAIKEFHAKHQGERKGEGNGPGGRRGRGEGRKGKGPGPGGRPAADGGAQGA